MTSGSQPTKDKYEVIGTRPIRHDGVDKVTGKALYGADIRLPGMLHGKVLRSPHAHARIKSIDTTKAENHPDILGVTTAKDLAIPDPIRRGPSLSDLTQNILASGKVLYKGHAVAAIAATNPHVAEEALSLIEVEYEVLPSVTNVRDAMESKAPVLHENWENITNSEKLLPDGKNVANHEQYKIGEVGKGFDQATLILEREYHTQTVHQGYIEPQNATAWWTPDGHVSIWCSSQGHFGIRDSLAKLICIPISKIRVIPMEIGGGFGGKISTYLEPIAAILSKKSGHPVKMTMTRQEVLEATGPAPGSYIWIRIGVSTDGRITAAQAYLAFEAGAFPGSPIGGAAACMFSPYNIENLLIDGYDIVNNKPKTSAYRAPGAPVGAFAVETMLDELAEKLAIDPITFRITNGAKEGTRRADGLINKRIGMIETAKAIESHPHYSSPLTGQNIGRGVAMGMWRNNTGPSSVVATVVSDGTVSLIEGSVDIGGSRPAIAQQLAEVLGIPVEDVNPHVADTNSVGFTSITGGSGVAFKTGWAAYEAAQDIKTQLVERAAMIWETSVGNLEYTDGSIRHKSNLKLALNFKELAGVIDQTGGPIVGRASVNPSGHGPSYAANVVDVEVDPETGKVTILRFTVFQDAGTAIHPSYVEGQMQGGSVQGIGWALNEEYSMGTDGQLLNSSLLDYRMPTSLDVPLIDTVILEIPNPSHPFGVRGVGEASIVPTMAAIANAIYNAIGVRINELPMSPKIVSKAIIDKTHT